MNKRTVAALLLLLAAVPLLGQEVGDHGLTISGGVTRASLNTRVVFRVELIRPEHAWPLTLELDIPGEDLSYDGTCSGTNLLRCEVPAEYGSLTIVSTLSTAGTVTATARILSPRDANPQNDQASWTIEVVAQPSLSVSLSAPVRLEPRSVATFSARVENRGAPANDVVLTLTPPQGGTFTGEVVVSDPTVTCITSPDTIVCTRASIDGTGFFSVHPEVLVPDRLDGSDVAFTANVTSSGPEFAPADNTATFTSALIRHLLVVNTNDEGAGSLRQALLDARQLCANALCTIDFRIPEVGAGGQAIIRVRSELPEVQGRVRIDGRTQTAFGGDTNPDGPEVVIDGSLAPDPARGLLLGGPSCEMYVHDLAIVNFPASGIQVHRGPYVFQDCGVFLFPNTLITGNHLSANYRGLMLVGAGATTIADNVIDANQRAGIFTDRSSYVEILRNRITSNGASGILLHLGQPGQAERAGTVENNVISGNGEWGIARVPIGDVSIRRNAIFDNRYLGIDANLDGDTPNLPNDPAYGPGIPNKPVLLSAHYDPTTNKTRVRGRLDSDNAPTLPHFILDFYASPSLSAAGQPEAAQWLADLVLFEGHTDFEVELDGDLRGKSITATNTRRHLANFEDFAFDTSELSRAVQVQ
ncbi:MAG TPA: right-handed parallel beta-helix repeat-containing protein [Thermoanaerobaculia bacterium]|nr:right-handed parallel beta-helix repeat-containing protein [Thermoanaerobaculia bacterium]